MLVKTADYINDYTLANYNISLNKEKLYSELLNNQFSLKKHIEQNFNKTITNDLKIQVFDSNKNDCIFLKFFDYNTNEFPIIYMYQKDEINIVKEHFKFLYNDNLIQTLLLNNQLNLYDELKIAKLSSPTTDIVFKKDNYEITNLSKSNLIETLLKNEFSLKQYITQNQKIKNFSSI